jgi:DNA-binding NarL/FixJ family response regulator
MTDAALRGLILDDSEADTELIVECLRRAGMVLVARRVESVERFAEALTDFDPDFVVSDHGLPGFSALEALGLMRERSPTTPFIVVSGDDDVRWTVSCLRAGADDVVSKGALEELPAALHRAIGLREGLRKLSPRQVEVLCLIVKGNTTPEIAERLGISVKTVQTHRGALMSRLDIHDVSGLVRYAVRVRLVPPDGDWGRGTLARATIEASGVHPMADDRRKP